MKWLPQRTSPSMTFHLRVHLLHPYITIPPRITNLVVALSA